MMNLPYDEASLAALFTGPRCGGDSAGCPGCEYCRAYQRTQNERMQIQEVFGLTGGELADVPWNPSFATDSGALVTFTFTYWYEGVPEYAESDFRDWSWETYRTVCRDEIFGQVPETVTDDAGVWHVVARFATSGEVECPGAVNDGELAERFPLPCPLCEAQAGEDHGYIYIGDGWSEIVYKLEHVHEWGPLERSAFAGTVHRKCQSIGCSVINALDDDDDEEGDE